MKSKIIITALLATILLLPFSCSDEVLDQVNPNEISTLSFWRNEVDARLAVNGMYHPFTGTFHWGRITHVGALLRTDAMNILPNGSNTAMSTFDGEPGISRWALEPYQESYAVIFRANSIMENVNSTNVPDQAARNSILGQAFFFRAFTYFYLTNVYGDVPLVTSTPDLANDDDLFPSQSGREAIWDLIVSDFAQAESMLPAQWTGEDLGRPTSFSAAAMRGKSLLYRSGLLGENNFGEAASAFMTVVNSGNFSLLPLSQYSENFTQVNENNSESVFELQYHPIGNGNFVWGRDIPNSGTQGNFVIEYAPPTQSPDQGHVINPWVRDIYEANGDIGRRNATIAFDYPGATVNAGTPFTEGMAGDIEIVNALVVSNPANQGLEPIFSRKYSGLELPVGGTGFLGDDYGPNWRIVRYSDVLLMLAESLNASGQPDQAEPFINMVRARAEIAPLSGLSQAEMGQAIINERVMELTGEGHRFFDLARWGLAERYLGANSAHPGPHPKSISGGVFNSGRDEVVWIPRAEILANPNLNQNPGY